ncbi:MAG: rhamnose utilization protein RhaD (predicted bifunctional aldolase and dehydrogenase) [Candidatus Omnitrophota bacterium]|jgi:rhamnose utilization protein RhaD (predicted bifunctional aldolase and dehydrogenase)/NAD(P)-dependent dehydrogenase (short-subunit alcohol dehydrogenase family)
MENLYSQHEADKCNNDLLTLRVYTSQLLGQNSSLVLHGGGNTSVKVTVKNLFGESENVLYVKGSGWDLATIEAAGFAPVKMDMLLKMAELSVLDDESMVRNQRAAMTDPSAPNPSVEAILHALIPFTFVDHSHTDAIVTITNTANGEARIKEIYGERVFIVPYVMPGFDLARDINKMTKGMDWTKYDGMVLLNHGLFTWGVNAKESYDQHIALVSEAENYLKQNKAYKFTTNYATENKIDLKSLATLRKEVSTLRQRAVLAVPQLNDLAAEFSTLKNVKDLVTRGLLTPDHVIRNKRIPAVIESVEKSIGRFADDYAKYFKKNKTEGLICLDKAPRWALWPNVGTVAFGLSVKECNITSDITTHTIGAILSAEALGGWKALEAKDIFAMEYWVLEQAKLKKGGDAPVLQGKIAIVTGAASGIGRASVENLMAKGATVVALDINPEIKNIFTKNDVLPIICDVTDEDQLKQAIKTTVKTFGGLDIVVSNAGTFPPSENIEDQNTDNWQKSMDVNLSSHQYLLKHSTPFLKLGIDPAVVIIASKNVAAPGPGAGAYSVAKAGLTQLARVAALEYASDGIRVNVVHPNAVFDTAIWTDEVLTKRAANYNLTVDEYKTNNLLKVEITSHDVAQLISTMAGPIFSKTTGSQVSIDGGNERTI